MLMAIISNDIIIYLLMPILIGIILIFITGTLCSKISVSITQGRGEYINTKTLKERETGLSSDEEERDEDEERISRIYKDM